MDVRGSPSRTRPARWSVWVSRSRRCSPGRSGSAWRRLSCCGDSLAGGAGGRCRGAPARKRPRVAPRRRRARRRRCGSGHEDPRSTGTSDRLSGGGRLGPHLREHAKTPMTTAVIGVFGVRDVRGSVAARDAAPMMPELLRWIAGTIGVLRSRSGRKSPAFFETPPPTTNRSGSEQELDVRVERLQNARPTPPS